MSLYAKFHSSSGETSLPIRKKFGEIEYQLTDFEGCGHWLRATYEGCNGLDKVEEFYAADGSLIASAHWQSAPLEPAPGEQRPTRNEAAQTF